MSILLAVIIVIAFISCKDFQDVFLLEKEKKISDFD